MPIRAPVPKKLLNLRYAAEAKRHTPAQRIFNIINQVSHQIAEVLLLHVAKAIYSNSKDLMDTDLQSVSTARLHIGRKVIVMQLSLAMSEFYVSKHSNNP